MRGHDAAHSSGLTPDVFRAILELADDAILVLDDASGRILDVNEATCAAFGQDRGSLLHVDAGSLVERSAAVGWALRRAQIDRNGGHIGFETSFVRGDGSTFAAEVRARRVVHGGRAYLVATLRDITERRRVVAALRASEERFRLLVDALHVGVVVQSSAAEILLSNPKAHELLGVTEDQLRGKTSFDPEWNVIHEDGSPFPGRDHPVPKAIATGHPQRHVVMGVYRPATRDRVWLLVDAEPQVDREGRVETVVCTFSDVTALKDAERALRVSEARLREAQRIARVGSFEWSYAVPNVTWSDEVYRIMGVDRATFVTSPEAVLGLQPPDEQERIMRIYEEALRGGAPGYEWETRFSLPDGNPREIYVRGEFVRDASGAVVGARGTLEDITERKRAARALAESEERYRRAQKLEAVGRLAGGIAHDFNNMLSPILGFASMIRGRLPEGDPLREPVEIIEGAAERASALTKQLLAFSRHQAAQARAVDLNAVLSELARILPGMLGEDVRLTMRLAPKLGRVLADPSQMEQVVMNLAVNAREAMPGGGELTFTTDEVVLDAPEDAARGRYVRLTVSDTGPGVDEATKARLFEPFFTTKEHGTGLGLATVYAIVKQWRGDVRVVSAPGDGARFEVLLPYSDAEATSPAPAPPLRASAPSSRARVLVVEDDDLVRRTTCSLLRDAGYAVTEASNGADGLAIVRSAREPWALLVTDVVMPGMSGLELVTQACRHRPELKALLLSGYSPEVVSADASIAASLTFLAKPFKSDELLDAVARALA